VAEGSLDLDESVDLKMLPAWVSEPPPGERYAAHTGADRGEERRGRDRRGKGRKGPTPNFQRPTSKAEPQRPDHNRGPQERFRGKRHDQRRHHHGKNRQRGSVNRQSGSDRSAPEKPLPPIAVKFLPRAAAFENVVEQIKSGAVAYSLFALARLFLEKATRHDVQLTAPENVSLFQLGESGAISVDRSFLERSAFRSAQNDFYKVDITETEPIKGNYTNVARDRLSGTLLGPTNHHDYQRRLRNLYEQRFSRRMSFGDYQRQIQIVTDPAEIEKWKQDARKVTTFTTLRPAAAGPQTFSSATEAEKHFNQHYLPNLARSVSEVTIDGPTSRQLQDRVLNKVIENEWTRETRSPSPMMQELAARFREAGLHVFRHSRGMLFVSSIYPRPLTKEQTAVSSQVQTIVNAIAGKPRMGRKELADKLIANLTGEDAERAKLALASDLLWLISAGHLIEFNDGSLDLPRSKTPKAKQENSEAAVSAVEKEARVEAGAPPADESPEENSVEVGAIDPIAHSQEPTEIGGS
jgi:hypothetical protein